MTGESRVRLGTVKRVDASHNSASGPASRSHVVQLYGGDELFFARSVSEYVHEGLRAGDSAVIVATHGHIRLFLTELRRTNADVTAALLYGRLVLLDANDTLPRIVVDGHPDWERFRRVVEPIVDRVRQAKARVRVYGELVGELWRTGHYSAALRLEEFWNRLVDRDEFSLFCGYPIDIFKPEFQSSSVLALLCDHARIVPSVAPEALESALAQAIAERLGENADRPLRFGELKNARLKADLPCGEAAILWLRENWASEADGIIQRARALYRAG